MTDLISEIFGDGKAEIDKLLDYGFKFRDGIYEYKKRLVSSLDMTVTVADGRVYAVLTDPELGEPYTLHLVPEAEGGFVGQVRAEYEEALTEIAEKCFNLRVFKKNMTEKIVAYIKEKYGDELEFLWGDDYEGAIWRRKDNCKWYGVLMSVEGEKFGRRGKVEIIDLKISPEALDGLVDGRKYFRGYHMNKKRWLTVVLDGSVAYEEICGLIDESYVLALGK